MIKINKEEKMIAVDYQIAYMEVLEILKHIPVNDYKKIPENRLRLFEKYAKKDIDFHYDTNQTLDEQNVSEEAKILIAILFRDYWATHEQREKILASEQVYQEKVDEEKRKKYNSDNIFYHKNAVVDNMEKEKTLALIETKNVKWYKKIWTFLSKFLKK